MKTLPNSRRTTYCLLLCLQALASGAEIPKLTNVVALNLPGAWDGGVVPTTPDVMLWNNLYVDKASSAAGLSALGGDMSVSGIKVTNVGGNRNTPLSFVGFQNPTSANTLTLGAAGIDMSTATQAFLIQSKITIGADQTWNIGNANTDGNSIGFNNNEDLAFQALAAGAAFNFGGRTVTTTGNGYVTISSGYSLSNGTLATGNNLFVIQGGGSTTTNILNTTNLVVNSGRLRLQSNSGAGGNSLVSAAPVTVNGGTFEMRGNNATNALTHSGNITLNNGSGLSFLVDSSGTNLISGNIAVAGSSTWRVTGGGTPANGGSVTGAMSGAGNISYLNTGTGTGAFARLSGDNSGYTGTFTLNGASGNRSLRLGGANSGSAAATWDVALNNILQVDGLSVQLGTLNGAGTVTNSHAANPATVNIGAGAFSGSIIDGTQPIAVNKVGSGVLRLTGLNTYTGLTTVTQGSLFQSPDHSNNASAISVADGGTYGAVLEAQDTALGVGDVTVGTTTGATLAVDYKGFTNPAFESISVNNLRFNGASTIKLQGKALTTGTFPVVQYATLDPASTPVSGLSLVLPTRTTGTLSNVGSTISVNIASTEQVKWNGNLSENWDIDPDGTGSSGTLNWLTTVTNAPARYLQGTAGTDVANFDDSATGSGTVNLTAALSPVGVIVNNAGKAYTFTGSGKLTGDMELMKMGTGVLTLANTTPNDFTDGTVILEGSLRLGDGTTAGAGIVPPKIWNEGTLVLNRPDNHDYGYALEGPGTLEKAQANTVSFPVATSFGIPISLTAGKLRFVAGGSLTGALGGAGELEAAGGILEIGGTDPNTNTGLTTVSAGTLRLTKAEGTNAVGGNISITGGGVLAILANEQVPDTATISALGTSADSLAGSVGTETFANAVVSGPTAATQLILRNNSTVTGTATVNQGILGVASAHTANVEKVVLTSPTALVRVAAGSAASTMNIGSGGITASGGEVQVKFNTNDQDAFLNLAGDVTTTGNLAFTNANYPGGNQNIVNLSGNRIFDIGNGTTTTVSPDLSSAAGNLTKAGGGTLTLNAPCAADISGGTTVAAGSLLVNGTLAGSVQIDAAGTLGGSGTLSGTTIVDGTVSPGAAIGKLTTAGLTLAPGSDLVIGVGNWAGATAGTDWDLLEAASLAITATTGNPLVIHVTGSPTGFSETSKTIAVATSTAPITGFNLAAIQIDSTGFTGTGTWAAQLNGNSIELVYTAGVGSAYDSWASGKGLNGSNNGKSADPDNDGDSNLVEFALNGVPLSGAANPQLRTRIANVGGQQALTLTFPVRSVAGFNGGTDKALTVDGMTYRVRASDGLDNWNLIVTEVTGTDATAIQTGLPGLPGPWVYRTFRSPSTVTGDQKEFIQLKIEPAP